MILVSACLAGVNCKYSGGNNENEEIKKFTEGHEIVKKIYVPGRIIR